MKFKTIVCGLLLSVGWCRGVMAVDDDGTSVFSEDSSGGSAAQSAGRGREAWEKTPDFSSRLRQYLRPFTYLRMPVEEGELENQNFFYNTYPFDLPASDVETGTLVLSQATPFINAAGALLPNLHQAMRTSLNQIIVTDFPDVSALIPLKNAFGDEDAGERISFGFHFFGCLPNDTGGAGGTYTRLVGIRNLFDAWGAEDSLARCKHLDFAIASPRTPGTVDLRNDGQRTAVLNAIGDILASPGLAYLETLSLRFMHLTSDDLTYLTDQLLRENRPHFKRLILSFNDINDSVMTEDGAIGRILVDRIHLPKLQVLDLRGNSFENIATWDLDLAINTRRQQLNRARIRPLLRLSNHGFTAAELDNAAVRAKLAPLTGFTDLQQPDGYTRSDTQHLKQSYDGQHYDNDHPLARKFLERWTLPNPSYKAIGDSLLVLRNGQNVGFTSLDLKNRQLVPDYVMSFLAHAHGRQPLSILDLRRAYAEGAEHREETHRTIADYVGTFMDLRRLSLSSNLSLGNILSPYYGEVLGNLPALRGMTLASIGLGSGAAAAVDAGVNTHFGNLLMGLHGNRSLRLLDYSGNVMNDADLGMVLPRLSRSTTLGYVSLKGNRITLRGGMAGDGYGTSVVNFLREVKGRRAPGNTCLYLDLTDNPITAPVAQEVAGAYQASIVDATVWPVLAIDGLQADGTRTPIQYVSSARGLLELAQAYDCEHLATTPRIEAPVAATWVDAFEDGSADKIAPAYQEAITEQSRVRIHAIYGALQAEPVAALDLAALPVALGDYLAHARGVLATYKVDVTDANVAVRAKLLRYADDNRAAMALAQGARGVAARKALFKALTEREQKVRIYNQLSSLATQDAPPITDAAVIERVLAALV